LPEIQEQIDRLVADLKAGGFNNHLIAVELSMAGEALAFNIPLEIVRSGDRKAIEREIVLRA
jgi:hypothetical protein